MQGERRSSRLDWVAIRVDDSDIRRRHLDIFNLATSAVDDHAAAEIGRRNAVSRCAKVENLHVTVSCCCNNDSQCSTHLNVRQIVPLHCSHTSPLIEPHLPHPAKVRQKIPHTIAVAHIPHLERPIAP